MHQVSSLWVVGAGADACKRYARWWRWWERWWESRTTEAALSWNMSAICQNPTPIKASAKAWRNPKTQMQDSSYLLWDTESETAACNLLSNPLSFILSCETPWVHGEGKAFVHTHLAMLIYFKIIIIQFTYVEYKWYILFEISWTIQKYIEKVKIMKRINRTLHENSQTQICVYLVIPFTSSSKTGPMNLRW